MDLCRSFILLRSARLKKGGAAMVLLIAVLAGLLIIMTLLYLDMRWQFRQYKAYMSEEIFKDIDPHTIPTEPLFLKQPLPKPKRRKRRMRKLA